VKEIKTIRVKTEYPTGMLHTILLELQDSKTDTVSPQVFNPPSHEIRLYVLRISR